MPSSPALLLMYGLFNSIRNQISYKITNCLLISPIIKEKTMLKRLLLIENDYFCECFAICKSLKRNKVLSIKTGLTHLGKYVMLMGRVLSTPDRWRMFLKQYVTEMYQLGYNSIGIVLIISFFIGAVICLQIKLNIQSPWMPRMVVGYTTREIMLLEFSSSIMCLILAGKVGSNIASEIGTMRITQQIDALDIMGVNSANYLILPKIMGLMTIMPLLVTLSVAAGIGGAYATSLLGTTTVPELTEGFRYEFNQWFFWCGMIKAVVYAFIITSVSAYKGYTVEGGSVEVGKSSTDAVVQSSVLVLFSDIFLTNMLT